GGAVRARLSRAGNYQPPTQDGGLFSDAFRPVSITGLFATLVQPGAYYKLSAVGPKSVSEGCPRLLGPFPHTWCPVPAHQQCTAAQFFDATGYNGFRLCACCPSSSGLAKP